MLNIYYFKVDTVAFLFFFFFSSSFNTKLSIQKKLTLTEETSHLFVVRDLHQEIPEVWMFIGNLNLRRLDLWWPNMYGFHFNRYQSKLYNQCQCIKPKVLFIKQIKTNSCRLALIRPSWCYGVNKLSFGISCCNLNTIYK